MFPADQLVTALTGGVSALIVGSVGTAELLDVVALRLVAARIRVLRVRPPYPLLDFMDQVSPGSRLLGDAGLAQSFKTLTSPDAACDRIALLVEDAHLMQHATLRYIELALRAGPRLHVALAGQAGFADTLALNGFEELRGRIGFRLVLTGLPAISPSPRSFGVRHRLALKCAAVAAGLAIIIWRHYPPAAPFASFAASEPGAASWSSRAVPTSPSGPPSIMDLEPPPEPTSATAESPPEADVKPILPPSRTPDPAIEPPALPGAPALPNAVEAAVVPEAAAPTLPLASDPVAELAVPPAIVEAPIIPEAALPTPLLAPDLLEEEPSPPPAPPAAIETTTLPEVVAPTPPLAAAQAGPAALPDTQPTPPASRRVRPRSKSARPERPMAQLPATKQNEQRCSDIALRVQLGENPTNADQTFLRNGCR